MLDCQEPQDRELGQTAEKELVFRRLLEPASGSFGMYVPAPQKRQEHIGVKEIRCRHKFVRWSGSLWGP